MSTVSWRLRPLALLLKQALPHLVCSVCLLLRRHDHIGVVSEEVQRPSKSMTLGSDGGLAYTVSPRAKPHPRYETQEEDYSKAPWPSPCVWYRFCGLARDGAVR